MADVGDAVAVDDLIVVIETDKVAVEVRAQVAGKLSAQHAEASAMVEVGKPLYTIEAGAAGAAAAAPAKAAAPAAPAPAPAKAAPAPGTWCDSVPIGAAAGARVLWLSRCSWRVPHTCPRVRCVFLTPTFVVGVCCSCSCGWWGARRAEGAVHGRLDHPGQDLGVEEAYVITLSFVVVSWHRRVVCRCSAVATPVPSETFNR